MAGVKIPEGEVVRIAADGEVLWEQASGGGLPAGYTSCEYIQFSGQQQFDTGIVPTEDTTIDITFTRESSSSLYMYGVRNSANTASVTAYMSSSGAWRFGNTYRNYTISQNKITRAVVSEDGVEMDGVFSKYVGAVKAFTANGTLTVGATRGTSGGLGSAQFVGKIYGLIMYDAETLVRDYRPCRNPEGVYGFWENVGRTFVPSSTSTAFTGG